MLFTSRVIVALILVPLLAQVKDIFPHIPFQIIQDTCQEAFRAYPSDVYAFFYQVQIGSKNITFFCDIICSSGIMPAGFKGIKDRLRDNK